MLGWVWAGVLQQENHAQSWARYILHTTHYTLHPPSSTQNLGLVLKGVCKGWERVHGSSRGFSNHVQCSVVVLQRCSLSRRSWWCWCCDTAHAFITQPSLLFVFHIVIVKCAWDCLSYLNVLKSVSLVVVRCGFLFLGLSLLSDALDINIIVQQWPRRVIHLCTLSSGLQTCLSAQCCRCLACSSSTASTIQHAFTGHEADMGFKSKC